MLVLRAAVLATAALHAHAIALASQKVSPIGPFDEPFDDFYDFDQYDDRWRQTESRHQRPTQSRDERPSESLDGSDGRKPWVPPPRVGDFPFRGPHVPIKDIETHWENRLLIVPDKKFAFCYIEKNACTQFNRLINALNNMPSGKIADEIPFWKSNNEGKLKWNYKWHQASNGDWVDPINKANGWKFGIFVRDPAERFLSAWLSKCDAWEYGGIDCLGPKIQDLPDSEKVELFEKTVLEVLPKYMDSVRKEGFYNAHYDPQHLFCGGRRLEEYDFVGELSGSPAHIHEQVVDMLKRDAGIEASDGKMHLARELFPSQSSAGHGTGSSNLMKQFFRNRTIYNKVVELYAEDYRWGHPILKSA